MAAHPLTFHKTVVAEGTPVANGVYFIKTASGTMRLVVTGNDGVPVALEPAPRFEGTFPASSQWFVNHNLGARPAGIRLLTPGGVEFEAKIVHTSANQFVVSVSPPVAGQVIVQ